MKKIYSIILVLMLCAMTVFAAGTQEEAKGEETTIKVLMAWNGVGVVAPEDPVNNPVALKILEKTGVRLDVEYITISELEKLTLTFASGEVPDLVNAPFWGGSDGATKVIKKAASEGLLFPLNDKIDNYPNVKAALTEGVAQDFRENDLEPPVFEGNLYIIPWQTPRSAEDITNWGYGVYVREDILKELNVDPSDLRTSDDLYDLFTRMNEGDFQDIYGNPIIPAGNGPNGWAYECFVNSNIDRHLTAWRKDDSGKVVHEIFAQETIDRVLYMRKLMNEKLYDPEALRQIDSLAKEKWLMGKYGAVTAHYPYVRDTFKPFIADHPEMNYVPVGPIVDARGRNLMPGTLQLKGRAGTPAAFLGGNTDKADAVLRFLDYINSEEGIILTHYGIEGRHYEMVDGKPRMKQEWIDKYNEDVQLLRNEGIMSVYTWFLSRDPRMSLFGEVTPGGNANKDEVWDSVKEMYPLDQVEGYRISFMESGYEKIEEMRLLNDPEIWRDIMESAYYADSEEKAIKIVEDYRQRLLDGGYGEFMDYMTEVSKTRTDFLF